MLNQNIQMMHVLNLLDGAAYKEILESLELYQIYI
jgi:hypothetical protein